MPDEIPPSLSDQLLDAVAQQPITRADRTEAAWFVLDAVACIVGAQREAAAQPVLAWARSEPVTAGRRAFVYGALSNVLELDAMHRASATHPGTVVLPAAAAMASVCGADGEVFLDAVLRGFEIAARIGEAAGAEHARLYQATSTCCPFGAAAAAAWLLGLDTSAQRQALGNAGTRSGGLWQFVEDGSLTKQWHAGRSAEDGVAAAQLAARGLSGPQRVLEGAKGFFKVMCPGATPSDVLRQRSGWSLCDVSYKPWPSPRHTHPAIDAALRLEARPPADISEVHVETYAVALQLCNMVDPQTEHAARFSIAHCVAVALTDGQVGMDSFGASVRANLRSLGARVTVEATERFTSEFPQCWGAAVTVRYTDASSKTAEVRHTRGDPLAPMSASERYAKAVDLMDHGGVEHWKTLADQILAMATGGPFPQTPFNEALKL